MAAHPKTGLDASSGDGGANHDPAGNIQASDIPQGGWVDRLAPPKSRPFIRLARLDRPRPTVSR